MPAKLGFRNAQNVATFVSPTDPLPVTVAGGVAGTPAGPVQSVQGVESGTPMAAVGTGECIKLNPVVTAGLYAANDIIGGKLTLANAARIAGGLTRLENILITDRANQKAAGFILIFDADPTAATLTNDGPLTLSTDDFKVVARIDVSAASYLSVGSTPKAVADIPYAGRLMKAVGSRNLYAVFVTTSTPTYAATTDIQIQFNFSYAS